MEQATAQGTAGAGSSETEIAVASMNERTKEITIYVNAEPRIVTDKDITFEEVVGLASGLPTGTNILYGVTYQRGHGSKPMGTLVAGQTTKVKHEMIFSVTATDKS